MDNGEHVLINSETGEIVAGANYESWIDKYKAKKNGQAGVDKVKDNKEPKWEDYKNEKAYKKAIHNYYNPKPNRSADETYNDFLEYYKNAKTCDELYNSLKEIHGNMWQSMTNFGQLNEEQKRTIKREYALKYLELQKEEKPEEYQEVLQLWKKDKSEADKGIYEEHLRREKAKQKEPTKSEPKKQAEPTTLSKEQYLKAKKDLKYTQELIDFHKSELEGYHPNDKMNREYKEREIAELESSNKARQEAIAEYEKANPPVNAEKTKKEKPKKIGKTYSITYDNETIEKLKTIGKNWKDRRIYFKELDNGYYDLENDKWVTDSPQLTEKALNMAAENETEKTARLEAEKREAERKAEEEKRIKAEKDEAKRRVAEAVKNRMASPSFEADFFNAMNNAGMFNDFDIPQGSINKITGEFFTDDELSAWYHTYKYSSDTEANLKDIVYSKVKKELDNIKNMYRPQKWGDWLIYTKGIDNGSNTNDYSGLEEMMDAYNYTEFEKEITRAYEDIQNGITKMSNSEAWAKYGDEFNKYKSEFKAGAKEKMRAYVKEKLAGIGSNIKVDSKIDINNIDNDINVLVDNLIRFVDKKDFDESKIKRDKDGKFAKKSGNKDADNDKKDNSKDADKEKEFKARLKEARRIKRYLTEKMKTTTMSAVEKDRYKETLKRTEREIEQIKEEREKYFNPEYHKDNKDNDKSKDNDKQKDNKTKTGANSGLDYGDLPSELHEPFKRLNTTTKPAELIFNNDNKYGLTIDDVKEISADYSNPVDTTYCNIISFEINNDEGDTEEVDLTNRDNLQSPIEKFLYDFTCNSDNAKNEWGDQWENEIKPQLKQMIKNAPVMKGKAYRVETFHANREEIVEGGKINFDCRSVSDNNKGYETVCNFSQPDYEYGEDIIIFEFPEDTRGLNIQGCSVYPNQYEYLVDGDFIMETVEKDEFDRTIVRLKKAE